VTLKKKLQAHIVYGFLGTTVKNTDRFALEVMNYVLAGQGGRLFIELRDKRGLAYAVSSSTQEGLEPGYITVYMGTDVSKLDDSLKGIREELDRIRMDPVSEDEIERAKRFIIGNYALDLQKNSSIAAMMAYHVSYGMLPGEIFRYPEKIERVTREDILRVAKKYLRPEASVLSVIRN
jgi:zinc protease